MLINGVIKRLIILIQDTDSDIIVFLQMLQLILQHRHISGIAGIDVLINLGQILLFLHQIIPLKKQQVEQNNHNNINRRRQCHTAEKSKF